MIFLSRAGQLRVVLVPEGLDYIKVAGSDAFKKVRIPGKTVQFSELRGQGGRGGWTPPGAQHKRGYRGIYETEDADEIKYLVDHRGYGTEFVAAGGSGAVLPDKQAAYLELGNTECFFEDLADGRVQCTLNGRIFKSSSGAEGYKRSTEFKELLAKEQERLKASLVTA
jgi:hypothetical protein